jgi:hypothetical protein
MTTSTLHAASKALDSLLAGTPSKPSSSKPRRKRTSSKKLLATVDINDLDPAARAQREAEEKKRIDEAVKQLMRGTKLKKDELEVRERVCSSSGTGDGVKLNSNHSTLRGRY